MKRTANLFLYLITLSTICVVKTRSINDNDKKENHCRVIEGLLVHHESVVCKITDIRQLESLMAGKTNVTHLDLSNNKLQVIPGGSLARYSSLVSLSLTFNEITDLTYEAFYGLDNLTTLNLTKNPLRFFTGNLSGLFSSLSWVDATGIEDWTPEKEFLKLRMLKEIIGWRSYWGSYWGSDWHRPLFCRCSLYRNNVTWSPDKAIISRSRCFLATITVNNRSFIVNLLNNTNFAFSCSKDRHINTVCKLGLGYSIYFADNYCWDEQLLAFNCQSFLGGLAVFLNLIVFLTIVTSKSLRNNVSMLFVCNMAFSDFVLGVYFICICIYLNSFSFYYLDIKSKNNCFKIGFLWVLGQASTVVTSFLLTLERYLVIVYSLNSNVRINLRMAMILILACWLLAVFLTGYALYHNLFKYSMFCVPVAVYTDYNLVISTFSLSGGTFAILSYLTTFIFYIHIYITVKRTAQNAGIKRESKLAKNIALLVSTNVFFFVLPVVCLSFVQLAGLQNKDELVVELLSNVFLLMCLSLNSCFNPILHAFRTDSFTRVLKERVLAMQQRIRSILSACRALHLTQRVHPENS